MLYLLYGLALLTALCTLAKVSVSASRAVKAPETLLEVPVQLSKKERSHRRRSSQQVTSTVLSTPKSFRLQARGADRPPLHPSRAKSAPQPARSKRTGQLPQKAQAEHGKNPQLPAPPPSLRISFRPEQPSEPEACIIPDVCLAYNYNEQRTFVPEAYRAHETLLQRCLQHRPGLQFYNPAKPSTELRDALRGRHDVDLIGVPLDSAYWAHFPHFVLEYIKYIAVPASLFLRPRPPSARWMCSGSRPGALTQCSSTEASWLLSPKIVLSKLAIGKPGSWTPAFLDMLHPRNVHWIQGLPLPKKPPLSCFRSMLTSPLAYDITDKKRDRFVRGAGISRKRIAACAPRIVVIARSPKNKIDRTIPEQSVRRLREELTQQMPTATIELLRGLGGTSLKQQVALFQRTDVLVTVHGAEMANLIFSRPGASVIEIFPFAYYFSFFRPMIESVRATHVKIVAKPDPERFLSCFDDRARRELPNLSEAERERIKKQFFSKVETYERARSEAERNKAGMYVSLDFPFRLCSRAQRIVIDPVKIAGIAVKEARRKCAAST